MLIVAILLYVAAIVALAHALERPGCNCRNSADREMWMQGGHMSDCASRQC